ncbi:iron-sulfur cluster assembly scaffold protein [Desulfococcus sp.]|uniref:iron-sulfur cluster assembly scaffold protein n=1 Tax=Desulfococcus sp. TaxID=2025834 RepID=UPI003594690F
MNQHQSSDSASAAAVHKMLSESGYSEKAISYFIEKPYMGAIADADQTSQMTGTCGDTMGVYLKFENGVIQDARYEVMGCAGAISAAMAAVDLIKGKTIEEARKLNDGDIFRVLQEIPAQKHHCIQLAVKTLQKALDEYTSTK